MKTKNNFITACIFLIFWGVNFGIFDILNYPIFAVCSINDNNTTSISTSEKSTSDKLDKIKNNPTDNPDNKNSDNKNPDNKNSDKNNETKPALESNKIWLFIYYTNKGHEGLFYSWSNDGLLWQQIRGEKPFLKPEVGGDIKNRMMRSPSICRGLDETYHIVWTVSWETRSIGYASSKDLINWSKQKLLPLMEHEKNARNTWGPELFYDDKNKRYYIIWASTVSGKFNETAGSSEKDFNHRLYYTTTTDFIKFTPTELYWNPDHNVMDPLLIEDKNNKEQSKRYLLFYKDETLKPTPKKHLLLATGASPIGPFNVQKIVSHTDWVQGPSVLKINGYWYLYYDCYGKRHFGAVRSNDLNTWTNITEKLCFPQNARQGTIIEINKDILKKLQEIK